MDQQHLSHLATLLINAFERREPETHEKTLTVNPVISKLASLYEKLRNAMEYREDEVFLRATIERILRRRLLLGGNAKTTAEPLIREVMWGGYLAERHVPVSKVGEVEKSIDLFLRLRMAIMSQKRLKEKELNEWTYNVMSADIEHILNPNIEKETITNFMFHVLKDDIEITDDTPETTQAQVFIAVRKAFARDDVAFLRYHLFTQYFGQLNDESFDRIVANFIEGYEEIARELAYPLKERIFTYVRKRSATFLILEDILRSHKGGIRELAQNPEQLKEAVFAACDVRYKSIKSKVRGTIVRSVILILTTKLIFAFLVEGTYDRIVYGGIQWGVLAINTSMPPLIMVIVSLFIKTPDKSNSERVLKGIHELLFSEQPNLGSKLHTTLKRDTSKPVMNSVFSALWFAAFVLSFGSIVFILHKFHFNPASIFIFCFFLAIVSFLAYRISLTASRYTVGEKQGLITPVVDFLFMPVVRVGKNLSAGISQVNVLVFLFDFAIEAPFKVVFAFFEQLFHFLHTKSEDLG